MLDLQIGTRQIIPLGTGVTRQSSTAPHSPSTSSTSSSVTIGDRSTAPTSHTAVSPSPKPNVPTALAQPQQPQPTTTPTDPSELSKRADDVIARLTASSSSSSSSVPPNPNEVQKRADDIITRIETEARARDVISRLEKQTQPPPPMLAGPGMMPMMRPYFGVMPMPGMMPQMMMGPGGMMIPVGPPPGMRMGFPSGPPPQNWRPAPPALPIPVIRPPFRPGTSPNPAVLVPRSNGTTVSTPLSSSSTVRPPTPRSIPPTPPDVRSPSLSHYHPPGPSQTPSAESQHLPPGSSSPTAARPPYPVNSVHSQSSYVPRPSPTAEQQNKASLSPSLPNLEPSHSRPIPNHPSRPLGPDTPISQSQPSSSRLSPSGRTRSPTSPPNPQNQIYLGSLPPSTTLPSLRTAFSALSPIVSIELRPPYAMIEFEDSAAADRAVEVYDEGWFGGVMICVERAVPRAEVERPPPSLKRPSTDVVPSHPASKRAR